MNAPHTETIEKFALEGPLTVGQAVGLGLALAILFAWTLWREGRSTHKWLTPLFWALRAVMLAVVLWMLLGPTDVTIKQFTTPRTVALFVDESGSMQTVDAQRGVDDVRWSLAHVESGAPALIVSCDRARVSAVAAAGHVVEATQLLERGSQDGAAGRSLAAAHRSVSRLQDALKQIGGAAGGGKVAALAGDLQRTVDGLDAELSRLASHLQSSQTLPPETVDQLFALVPRLEAAARDAERLAVLAERALDASSIEVAASESALNRHDRVMRLLKSADETWLKELSESVRIRRYRLSDNVALSQDWSDENTETGDADTSGSSTNLTAALERLSQDAAGEDVAAAFLFSDGRHNAAEGRHPRDVAAGLGRLPVNVVPIGSAEVLRDVIVHHVDAPPAVSKDDLISIEAIVTAFQCEGEALDVELLMDDRVIDRRRIEVETERADHRVSFTKLADTYGRHSFRVQATPIADEVNNDNNYAAFDVQTMEDSIRVLLADGEPGWEFRYLSNLFNRDKSLEYEQLLFSPELAGTGRLRNLPEFPRKADDWNHYRVVILGDVSPRQLDHDSQEALREYVTRLGGTLVLIAGQYNMPHAFVGDPLEGLLPVERADDATDRVHGYHLQLTAEGKLTDAMHIGDDAYAADRIWQEATDFPAVGSMSDYSRAKPTSHTLIRAVPDRAVDDESRHRAFLSWQMVGRGRVVYLSAPSTWRLRMRSGDRYHHQFWGQLIRWAIARELAVGSKTVRIRTDKSNYGVGEDIEAIVQLRRVDGTPVVGAELEARASVKERVAASVALAADPNIPGRYTGRLGGLAPGAFAISVVGNDVDELLSSENVPGPIETTIAVDPALSMEMADTRSDRPLLAQIAELTGGMVVPPTAVREVLQNINLSPHVTEETLRQPQWNRWICLWIVFGCLTVEWTIRKLVGIA